MQALIDSAISRRTAGAHIKIHFAAVGHLERKSALDADLYLCGGLADPTLYALERWNAGAATRGDCLTVLLVDRHLVLDLGDKFFAVKNLSDATKAIHQIVHKEISDATGSKQQ